MSEPLFIDETDEQLARRVQSGSMEAFEEIVLRYGPRIYSFAARSCGNPEDAREIAQDCFVKTFHSICAFDARRSFATWLFTIARRKCIDHHRAAPPLHESVLPEPFDENSPAELLAAREERDRLWDAAARVLRPDQFHVLWFRYAEQMTVAEIASVMRKTKTYTKVLLFRARQALARELEAGEKRTRAKTEPGPPGIAKLSGDAAPVFNPAAPGS